MESSQLFGRSEKCSSSESGWTSYIVSPIRSYDKSGDYEAKGNGKYNGLDSSDDSLASDASSGPSHLEHAYGNGNWQGVHFKQEEQESTSKYRSCKKAHKQNEKKRDEHRSKKLNKEDDGCDYKGMLIASHVAAPVQSGNKIKYGCYITEYKGQIS